MNLRMILASATMLYAGSALAMVDPPAASTADKRMRVVDYNPVNPVQIYLAPGVATRIQLGADEDVQTIVVSDQATITPEREEPASSGGAAQVSATLAPAAPAGSRGPASCDANLCRSVAGNFVYLKPLRQMDPQPLFIQTKRTDEAGRVEQVAYTFEVLTRPGDQRADTPNTAWGISFNYPARARAAKAAEAKRRQDAARAAWHERAARTPPPPAAPAIGDKWAYGFRGNGTVAPDEVWDDGRTTFMRFAGTRRIPSVYKRRAAGGEPQLVQYAVEPRPDGTVLRIAGLETVWVLEYEHDVSGCVITDGAAARAAATPTIATPTRSASR